LGAAVVGVVDEEGAERVKEEELFVRGEGGEVEEGVAEVGGEGERDHGGDGAIGAGGGEGGDAGGGEERAE
jgi:hypothetical protein